MSQPCVKLTIPSFEPSAKWWKQILAILYGGKQASAAHLGMAMIKLKLMRTLPNPGQMLLMLQKLHDGLRPNDENKQTLRKLQRYIRRLMSELQTSSESSD